MLADVEATGKRAGSRMAGAAKAIDKGLAARDSFGGCLDLEVRNRSVRACCLTVPTIVSAAANDTATTNTVASPITPHFTNLFLIRQARTPDQTSDVVAASIAAKPRMLAAHHPCSGLTENSPEELPVTVGVAAPGRSGACRCSVSAPAVASLRRDECRGRRAG